jgi:hypothetical protein
MPLQQVNLTSSLQWILTKVVTGFAPIQQGADSVTSNLSGINLSTFNQLFAQQFTLSASGGTSTFDLSTFTNPAGESTGFGHVLCIEVQVTGTGANVALSPGASNGLVWFFGGTSPTVSVPAGATFIFTNAASATGQVVDSTHKNLTLTNNGSGVATVRVVCVGSTS